MREDYVKRIIELAQYRLDYINMDAIFSDETPNYRSPAVARSNQRLTIKLRTYANDVDKAYIYHDSGFVVMQKAETNGLFDYFEGKVICGTKPLKYYFSVVKNGKEYYYNKQGVVPQINTDYNFSIIPDFETPKWAKGAVMYQIYVDRFFNGDFSNDVVDNEYMYLGHRAHHKNWTDPIQELDVCNFYGGDLQGVIDKLDYLRNMGVDAIYLNPIFVSPSNHKYDIQDYDSVDPHFGVIINDGGSPLTGDMDNKKATMYAKRTIDSANLEASNALFIKLIDLAHKVGMRVILDGVFNHCGAFNKWLDREGFYRKNGYPAGAYNNDDSIYHDFFKWTAENQYDCWWGHDNHPKFNYEGSKILCNYILEIAKKWVSPPFNADGWRLDVAADLGYTKEFNMKFWRKFRQAVKSANSEAIILAEHYGDPQDWLQGDQWDTVMNYDAFMEPVTWFLTGMEKHSESRDDSLYNNAASFEASMRYFMSRINFESMSVAMNELSNHDHSRFLTRTNGKVGRLHTNGSIDADTGINKAVMYEAIALQMTWLGAPTIYYGDEVGLTGWTDPDNRRPYPWGNEDFEIFSFYKKMIEIHKRYEVFKYGSLDYLHLEYGILCLGRWTKDEQAVIVINNTEYDKKLDIPIWRLGLKNSDVITRVVCSNSTGFSQKTVDYTVENNIVSVALEPKSSNVYVRSCNTK